MRLQPIASVEFSPTPAGARGGRPMRSRRRRDRAGTIPCPGCPIYPHIPDRDLSFPTCELCHWPAVDIGPVHVWHCRACRHLNRHGTARPRIAVVLLSLDTIDVAARSLQVADPVYGYFVPPSPPHPNRARVRPRAELSDILPARRIRRRRVWRPDGIAQPIYARATVAGTQVTVVGGDRLHPHPLGGNDRQPHGWSIGNRATRIACPCDQPAPCLHGQALYAYVMELPAPCWPEPATWPAWTEPIFRMARAS